MKTVYVLLVSLILSIPSSVKAQSQKLDVNVLVGTWKLDMTPNDKTDSNFAMMKIKKVEKKQFKGEFYREGVKIKNGLINTQLGYIYGALMSGDNSGSYNTSFYYKEGILHGSTHAVNRNFLSVWTATREE